MIYPLKYKGMFKSSYERNLNGVRGSENNLWNNDKDYMRITSITFLHSPTKYIYTNSLQLTFLHSPIKDIYTNSLQLFQKKVNLTSLVISSIVLYLYLNCK